MENLPNELLGHLCSFLDGSSLKALRLICKSFASIGEEHLFHDFEFRLFPSYHRLYQLEQLAANRSIASRLKCLSFESGVQLEYADYRYWSTQVYHDISSTWARGLATNDRSVGYESFHANLQARFPSDMALRYDLYRWHLDQQAAFLAETRMRDILVRTMNVLNKANAIFFLKIVMAEPQITLKELEDFDAREYAMGFREDPEPRRRVYNRRKHCLSHFENFLEAAHSSDVQIDSLVGVDMPHQLLTTDHDQEPHALVETFRNLQKIDIRISGFPHSDWLSRGGLYSDVYVAGRNSAARRLRMLLNNPSNLKVLKLQFPAGKEAEYSFELFDTTNLDRFPRLWSPHLQVLQLCHIRRSWEEIKTLLEECKNLKSLSLSHCRLETASMLDFLHFVPSMRLEHISLDGVWYVDEDSGEWHAHSKDDFSSCYASTSYEGPYLETGLRSKVEGFMLDGKDCPLPKWTPAGREEDIWEISGDTSFHYLPGLPRH